MIKSVFRKFNASYWLKSGFFTLSTKLGNTLFAFINFFLLIRVLSKDDYGAWILFFSTISFLELIKNGLIRNPLIKFLASAEKEQIGVIQTSSMLIHIGIGLVEILVLLIFAFTLTDLWDAPQLENLFLIYIVSAIFLIFSNHFEFIQQSNLRFNGTFLSHITRQSVLCVYIVYSYINNQAMELDHLAWAQTVAIFFSLVVAFMYAKQLIIVKFKGVKAWIGQLFHYGKLTLGTSISSTILKNVDKWMLGAIMDNRAVAIYDPAIRMSNLVEVPTDSLTSILFPQLAKKIKEGGMKEARYLYEKAVGAIMAVMVPTVLIVILLAGPIIRVIAGEGFEESVSILQITMLYGLILPFNRILGITLDAIGKAKLNFYFVMRNAVINVVLNYLFIPYFGIIGAAYATLSTYLFALIVNQYYLYVSLNVKLLEIFRHFISFYFLTVRRIVSLIRDK